MDRGQSPHETSELYKLGWRADPSGEIYFDDRRVPRANNVVEVITSILCPGDLDPWGTLLIYRG